MEANSKWAQIRSKYICMTKYIMHDQVPGHSDLVYFNNVLTITISLKYLWKFTYECCFHTVTDKCCFCAKLHVLFYECSVLYKVTYESTIFVQSCILMFCFLRQHFYVHYIKVMTILDPWTCSCLVTWFQSALYSESLKETHHYKTAASVFF